MKGFLASYGLELMLLTAISLILWAGFRSEKRLVKHLLFNLSAIFIVLFVFELYLTIGNRPQTKIEYKDRYYIPNSELGYGVSDSSFSVRATKRWIKSGKEVYDAYYSFAEGRRVTPDSDPASQQYSIFLGGSFTFGEGLNDSETLPYHYNQLHKQKRNIRNYGFNGYGTHQVYTIAKNFIVTDSALQRAENVEVYYWFIDPHILRANGYSPWDQKSARYVLENGAIKHTGTFKEAKGNRSYITNVFNLIWANSGIFNRIKNRVATGKDETDLVLRLIKETHRLFKEKGFEFTVLVQDTSRSDPLFDKYFKNMREKIVQYLEEQNIQFIRVDEAVFHGNQTDNHLIIPGDGHPTSEFNKRLADFVRKKSNSQKKIPHSNQ